MLLGFSTAGKSSILNALKEKHGEKYDYFDTDSMISKDFSGHIYNVFLEKWEKDDPIERKSAIQFIEEKENEVLKILEKNINKSSIIAASPFILLRPDWQTFIDKFTPTFFHLEIDAESVFEGLMKRHDEHLSLVGNKLGFGCWDLGMTKKYKDGKYILINKEDALKNIEQSLSNMTTKYKNLSKTNNFSSKLLKHDPEFRKSFLSILEKELL